MVKFLLTVIISIAFFFSGNAQQLDKLELRDGKVFNGNVIKVKTDLVEFKDADTDLVYEYKKAEIRYIALANGKILTFDMVAVPSEKEKEPKETNTQPVIIEKDSGSNVGLIILATIGGVLGLLLLIGAIAQSGN